MTATVTGTLVEARAPRAQVHRAVLHLVPVLFSDGPPVRAALCGYTPKRYPWTLRPSWPSKPCPLCAERERELRSTVLDGGPVSYAEGALTVELS